MQGNRAPLSELILTSFNMQVAIGSHRLHHLFSHGWRYLMPHGQSLSNLNRIAEIIGNSHIVALNEADAGSLRTRYVNQAEYVSELAGYPYFDQMVTRDLGAIAQHSNSVLSQFKALKVIRHRLPKPNDGRGVLEVHYKVGERDLVVLVTHLSLSRRIRDYQVHYIADIVKQYRSVVLMGDMNCTLRAPEMRYLLDRTHLHGPENSPATYPSWKPSRAIDHILISSDMKLNEISTIHEPLSDHLAVKATVSWP